MANLHLHQFNVKLELVDPQSAYRHISDGQRKQITPRWQKLRRSIRSSMLWSNAPILNIGVARRWMSQGVELYFTSISRNTRKSV